MKTSPVRQIPALPPAERWNLPGKASGSPRCPRDPIGKGQARGGGTGGAGPRSRSARYEPGPGLQGRHPSIHPRRKRSPHGFRARRAGERSRGARMEAAPLRYISARRRRARLSRAAAAASWLTAVRWAPRRPSPGISRSGRLRCRHGEAGERRGRGRERGYRAGLAAWAPRRPGRCRPSAPAERRASRRCAGGPRLPGRLPELTPSRRAGRAAWAPRSAVPFGGGLGARQSRSFRERHRGAAPAEGRRPQLGVSGADPASCLPSQAPV